MSHFAFLRAEWPAVHDAATRAETAVRPDPRAACFYARRAVELLVHWVYKHDAAVELPYQDNISALLHEPTFQNAVQPAVVLKARFVVKSGNLAVHGPKPVQPIEAISAVTELFHVCYWLAHTYARGEKPSPELKFDAKTLPDAPVPKKTLDQLQTLETQLRAADEKLSAVLANNESLDAELARLRAQIGEVKRASAATPDAHDYSESETRDRFIDVLLKEAGWPLNQPRDREFEVAGMPLNKKGFIDYVLWGDDGLPLAVVEAKKTRRNPRDGQEQAKLYADCLEASTGRRPVLFLTNGYEHTIWDSGQSSPRAVQGFYTKDELELLIRRRTTRTPLALAEVNDTVAGRDYQRRAVRKVGEAFEVRHERRALLVMATGAGKTRTVIALADLLTRCNWAKRVLFLADRVGLVNQALNAFKTHLPDSSPVNLVTEKATEGRVFVSTYPTMMGLIDEARDGRRRFGVGHFDLVVVDEAHRSVFQKYAAIFEYFDSYLVGLTATPRGEVYRNTYGLFHLDDDAPTDAYSLEEAVRDGYLVPARGVSVALQFPQRGIKFADLSEDDRDRWDELEWGDDDTPDTVEAAAVNAWLFNADTVDKALSVLMTRGIKVAGGDRLGKTIIFAKNQNHANFIADRFDANYPHLKGEFARVVTYQTECAQTLIDRFSEKDNSPHVAISVDMLDTGIDVPEVVNLVFFKAVRSKTKFWQMVGRGTRLCRDLFGPGRDKTEFAVFDFCGNLEFFGENPKDLAGTVAEPLGKQLFKARLELVGALDDQAADDKGALLRADTAEVLRGEVAAMTLDNFVVRPKRKLVEHYAKPEAWVPLPPAARRELADEVAGLPSGLPADAEEAKRFDLLMLRLQLAVLLREPSYERLRKQVIDIAGLLEEKPTIPMVCAQLELIQAIQTDEWWQDATAPLLEGARKRLRDLVRFLDKTRRSPVYTDFEDKLGTECAVELPGFGAADDFERFRQKARAWLRPRAGVGALKKVRRNEPLTADDGQELEILLLESGSAEQVERVRGEPGGPGLFIRSLIGLDRDAACLALAGVADRPNLKQAAFTNLLIEHLTERGTVGVAALYDSPFTDLAPRGPDGLFTAGQVAALVAKLERVASMPVVA